MRTGSRLNVLLTRPRRVASTVYAPPDWSEVLTQLLSPLLVRTFVAASGTEAIRLVESHAMHVAVVDVNLAAQEGPGMDAITVLRLLHRLRRDDVDRSGGVPVRPAPKGKAPVSRRIKVQGPETPAGSPEPDGHGEAGAVRPLVILLAPRREDRWLREALRWDVFSVLPEPLDINELLDVMARALRRFYGNHWPETAG